MVFFCCLSGCKIMTQTFLSHIYYWAAPSFTLEITDSKLVQNSVTISKTKNIGKKLRPCESKMRTRIMKVDWHETHKSLLVFTKRPYKMPVFVSPSIPPSPAHHHHTYPYQYLLQFHVIVTRLKILSFSHLWENEEILTTWPTNYWLQSIVFFVDSIQLLWLIL